VGKPHYISPEQFRGKPVCQSDIYSMGATLFYLATGVDPEPITTLRLKEYKPGADSKLATIIERSTKLDVSNRYQNAAEVLKQLS
jgi:serine/threonine protein kinase